MKEKNKKREGKGTERKFLRACNKERWQGKINKGINGERKSVCRDKEKVAEMIKMTRGR